MLGIETPIIASFRRTGAPRDPNRRAQQEPVRGEHVGHRRGERGGTTTVTSDRSGSRAPATAASSIARIAGDGV